MFTLKFYHHNGSETNVQCKRYDIDRRWRDGNVERVFVYIYDKFTDGDGVEYWITSEATMNAASIGDPDAMRGYRVLYVTNEQGKTLDRITATEGVVAQEVARVKT